jgi:hypothetical protein
MQAMSATNDNTVHGKRVTHQIPNLRPITLDAVNAAAIRMQLVDGVTGESVDIPDLLTALARVAESRPHDGDDKLVLSLVDLAALALLWSETADGLTAMLDDLPSAPSDERQGA